MYSWVNILSLISSLLLFSILYTLSTMPVTLNSKTGEGAWGKCHTYRIIASLFEMIAVVNMLLWVLLPIASLNWKISLNPWISRAVAIVLFVPCMIILLKGIRDAGKETITPSKETEMYGGIYEYIRHPQALGEMPLFILLGFAVNSLFLVILASIYVVIYTPIMKNYEEKDLVKRFGEDYILYQKTTGAFFPKLSALKKVLNRNRSTT